MKQKIVFIIILTVTFAFFNTGFCPAQEVKPGGKLEGIATPEEPEVQWVWGEVVTVDSQNKQITIKYLDYETYEEKTITVNVDEQTKFENFNSLNEIKSQDTVTIDYVLSPEGKNIAKNIVLEKPEEEETFKEETNEEPLKELPAKQ